MNPRDPEETVYGGSASRVDNPDQTRILRRDGPAAGGPAPAPAAAGGAGALGSVAMTVVLMQQLRELSDTLRNNPRAALRAAHSRLKRNYLLLEDK